MHFYRNSDTFTMQLQHLKLQYTPDNSNLQGTDENGSS